MGESGGDVRGDERGGGDFSSELRQSSLLIHLLKMYSRVRSK